jgi:hypothetical protein
MHLASSIRAVYLSETDSGASKEITARRARLGRAAQISTDKYPRVVYAVAVNLKRALDLSALGSSQARRSGEIGLSQQGRSDRFAGFVPRTRSRRHSGTYLPERRVEVTTIRLYIAPTAVVGC